MAGSEAWKRFWGRLKGFWHTENPRMAVVRDIAVAGLIVLGLLGGIWIYSGQPLNQAPVVSVESGSMMHGPYLSGDESRRSGFGDPPFGRLGTIDPGDIVFVKDVDRVEDVEVAFGPGKRSGYGGHGDVIVFMPDGSSARTRIIHRAMLYVAVDPEGCVPPDCTYRIPAACGPDFVRFAGGDESVRKYCQGSRDPPRMSLRRDGLSLEIPPTWPCSSGPCPSLYSGFITKGDNNGNMDQAAEGGMRISRPVRLDWIVGKARGEVPWFGLIKLALYGNCKPPGSYDMGTDPTRGDNWVVIRGCAPWDIWVSLFLSLGVLVSIPIVIDLVGSRLRARRRAPPSAPGRPGAP